MTIHSYHEDTHTHGLADDCPRCIEHTEHPLRSLDSTNIRRLLTDHTFTHADLVAAARLRDALDEARYLMRIVPELFGAEVAT